jgi:hypothetical protein
MESAPKSLGRVDSQRVKEIRFASATIVLGSVIIVLGIISLLLSWFVIEFGAAPAASNSPPPSNATQDVPLSLNPFLYQSSDTQMQLSFGVISEMSGRIVSPLGSHTFSANFRTKVQISGSVTLDSAFLEMCKQYEILSTDALHTNTFAVWLHYALCHVQPTVLMPVICVSIVLTFLSVLSWSLATWTIPSLDTAMPMWRVSLGLVLGRAISLYKCAFISAAALGLFVGADVVFWILISDKYTVFLKKYAEEQSKRNSVFAHSSTNAIGFFIALIATGIPPISSLTPAPRPLRLQPRNQTPFLTLSTLQFFCSYCLLDRCVALIYRRRIFSRRASQASLFFSPSLPLC